MAGVEDFYETRADLVFKALYGAVFVADYETAIPTLLFDELTGELQPLPPGWFPAGYFSEDGITHGRDQEIAETMSAQDVESIRDDLQSETTTAQFVMRETSPVSLAIYEGKRFDEFGAIGTPLTWMKASSPILLDRRFLFIAQDRSKSTGEPKYWAKLFPRGVVNEVGEAVANREEALSWDVTVKAQRDAEEGTSVLNWIDGPGWRELEEAS